MVCAALCLSESRTISTCPFSVANDRQGDFSALPLLPSQQSAAVPNSHRTARHVFPPRRYALKAARFSPPVGTTNSFSAIATCLTHLAATMAANVHQRRRSSGRHRKYRRATTGTPVPSRSKAPMNPERITIVKSISVVQLVPLVESLGTHPIR